MTWPKDEARYALYTMAHHDLWWARTQQWSVANWALLLIAAIAGVGTTVASSWCSRWPYVLMMSGVAFLAGWMFGSLHGDIVHNREVYRELEAQTGIGQLRKALPGQELGEEDTDWKRGIWQSLMIMVLAIAVATGLGVLLLGGALPNAVAVGTGILVLNAVWIWTRAFAWKERQQPCNTCSHTRLMHRKDRECFKFPFGEAQCTCKEFLA